MSKQIQKGDPTGYPDWTYPVSIVAQLIENLKVDISAQTLSQLNVNIAAVSETVTFNVEVQNAYLYVRTETGQNLTVDIAAQSLSALNINIAGSSTTLEVTNPEGQNLNVAVQDSITLNVQITGSSITLPVHEQGTANVSIQSSVTLDVNITGSTTTLEVTNPAGQNLNVAIQDSITINMNIAGSTITVPIETPEGSHVDVEIIQSITLNVNITGSDVTLNVNIASSSVAINIKTETGANIVIDKLTVTAYTEERRTITNKGTTAAGYFLPHTYMIGKYYPRGCRGFIKNIIVTARNTDGASHDVSVYISPQPGMGKLAEATFTIPGNTDPTTFTVSINKYWNYDSLFIWLYTEATSGVGIAYDTGIPQDAYHSSDGSSWTVQTRRYWIDIEYSGQTIGDLPVSGTVNSVIIPGQTTFYQVSNAPVQAGVENTLLEIKGTGYCDLMRFWVQAATNSAYTTFRVYVDGELAMWLQPQFLYVRGYTATTPVVSLLQYETGGDNTIQVNFRFSFRRSLKLTVYGQAGQADTVAFAHVYPTLIA